MIDDFAHIAGFPGYYVSRNGAVISVKKGKARALKCFTMKGHLPYRCVNLYREGKLATKRVAPLVCAAFHGPRPTPTHEAAHNNGRHNDDRAENLRWATPKENAADRAAHGTDQAGSANPGAKLTEDAVREIRATPTGYGVNVALAKKFGVSKTTIECARYGRSWKKIARHGVLFQEQAA